MVLKPIYRHTFGSRISNIVLAALTVCVFLTFLLATSASVRVFAATMLCGAEVLLPYIDDSVELEYVGDYYSRYDGDSGVCHDPALAKQYYKKSIAIEDRPWVRLKIGKIDLAQGNLYAALFALREELNKYPENTESYFLLGLINGYIGDNEQAEDNFRDFILHHPEEISGYTGLAWILSKQKEFKEVKEVVNTVFELNTQEREQNMWLWSALDIAHSNLSEYIEAKEAFVRARTIMESYPEEEFPAVYLRKDLVIPNVIYNELLAALHLGIGNYYFKTEHYDFTKARKHLILATEFDDTHLLAHYQLSRVYFIEGNFFSAVKEMDKVIDLDPEFEQAYYMKGLIHGFRGEYDVAAAAFTTFNKMRPTNWAGHNDLAWVYFSAGEYELARDAALSGLANSPENTWLNNSLGVALLNLGDTEGALEAFLKAEESANLLTPEDWGASYPGNDPRMYASGLEETKASILYNLELIKGRL